jgi:hypothetical protein
MQLRITAVKGIQKIMYRIFIALFTMVMPVSVDSNSRLMTPMLAVEVIINLAPSMLARPCAQLWIFKYLAGILASVASVWFRTKKSRTVSLYSDTRPILASLVKFCSPGRPLAPSKKLT